MWPQDNKDFLQEVRGGPWQPLTRCSIPCRGHPSPLRPFEPRAALSPGLWTQVSREAGSIVLGFVPVPRMDAQGQIGLIMQNYSQEGPLPRSCQSHTKNKFLN